MSAIKPHLSRYFSVFHRQNRYFLKTLALPVIASLPLSVQASPWQCQASEDGQGWQCAPTEPSGKSSTGTAARTRTQTSTGLIAIDLHPLDWVTADNHCAGQYLDPLANADQSITPEEAAIETQAGNSQLQGDVITLTDRVEVKQSYRQLKSDRATVNKATRRAVLEGNVELREPGILLISDQATLNSATGVATLINTGFVLHKQHLRGEANHALRNEEGLLTLTDGEFTYCPPTDNTWLLSANTIELDRNSGEGIARGAVLEIKDIPVFYTPYISFPLDDRRKSGFLAPDISISSDDGVDIATPYYFNLAENYDATLTPRYISDRGTMLETEFRHLSRAAGSWVVGGGYLGNDEQFEEDLLEEGLDEDNDRWISRLEQQGLFADRWRTRIDYTRVSDPDYFSDLGTTNLEARRQTHLRESGSVEYLGDNWLSTLRVQQFQTIARDLQEEYKKLPQLTLQKRRASQPFSPDYIATVDYTDFDHDTLETGERLYGELGIAYPMRWTSGFVTPTAKYKQLHYQLEDPTGMRLDESPEVGAGLFSLDAGLYFDRIGKHFSQTLEPRIFYLYTEQEDQSELPSFDTNELTFSYNQLFRESRFSGRDRIDDADQLALGLTTRVIDNTTGREQFTASVGQIFYFDDREVQLRASDDIDTVSNSEIATELRYQPNQYFLASSSVLWNSRNGKVEEGNLQLNYKPARRGIYNLSYNFDRDRRVNLNNINTDQLDIEQLNIASLLPLSRHWKAFLSARYGLESETFIEDAAGFEYEDCCWRVRIVHARTIDPLDNQLDFGVNTERDHATYIEFQLKGLGSVGNRVGGLLEELIWGYRESDY